MSERFIRCAHCGLPHDAHLTVCPTTGLRIEREGPKRAVRRNTQRDKAEQQQRMIGAVIDGKYRVHALIGEGGMSAIYRADHLGLDRRVAIKVLHPALADDPEAIARLRHEAQVVSTIGHANICEVFDLGRTESGSPYMVMELLVGQSLAERIKEGGAMPFMELAPLLKQVLAALQSAHDKGILHRDLKPENVFVEMQRRTGVPTAKLLDFGISKSMSYEFHEQQRLTHTGMVMGTPYYMAPEQARGDSGLDQRVDLWAVGVMMYEALTGRRPFVATNYNALLVKILTSRPRAAQKLQPSIPNAAAAIIDRALSKLREDRFQSAREFQDAIARAEREYIVDDPAAATMLYRRAPDLAPVPPAPTRASSRRGYEIEDPSTFIDDDFDYDPSQIGGPLREYHPPAPREYQSHDEWDADLVEPTIRERAVHHDFADPAASSHDTEVIRRPPRELKKSATEASDTDVMKRSALFSESEKTEVVLQSTLDDSDLGEFPSTHDDDRRTNPVPAPMASQTRTEPRPERRPVVRQPPPSQRTVVVSAEEGAAPPERRTARGMLQPSPAPSRPPAPPPNPNPPSHPSSPPRPITARPPAPRHPAAPTARANADPRDAARPRTPAPRPGSLRPGGPRLAPPRVPRPDLPPDDEEKTTLFNPALARALRELANDDDDSGKKSR